MVVGARNAMEGAGMSVSLCLLCFYDKNEERESRAMLSSVRHGDRTKVSHAPTAVSSPILLRLMEGSA